MVSTYDNDLYGILDEHNTQKEIDEAHDSWDKHYGKPPYTYYVYVLLDGTQPGKYTFGPLRFDHEPFYVGHGKGDRIKKSAMLSRQLDKYTHKVKRMQEIEKDGGTIRPQIVGYFYTKEKAFLVEKKVMNLITRKYLTNGVLHLCEVPLRKEDYNVLSLMGGSRLLVT